MTTSSPTPPGPSPARGLTTSSSPPTPPGFSPARGLSRSELGEIRAALAAGVSPAEALRGVDGGVLGPVARAVRMGRTVAEEAATVATDDVGANLLVRALGLAERTGVGGMVAVEQALGAVRQQADLERLLRVRTAQARGTAKVLTAVPVCAWLLLVAFDARALAFYGTPFGLGTALATAVLVTVGWRWSLRLVQRAERAPELADPLAPPAPPVDPVRGVVVGLPVLVIAGFGLGPVAGMICAVAVGLLCARPRGVGDQVNGVDGGGGAAETVELVALALQAGLAVAAAIETVASLCPPSARATMKSAGRRLRGGWTPDDAFAGTGLCALGEVLAVTERYGAPATDALRSLAGDLRAERRAAAEEAAERVQLSLVFPTTLLTLPAFALGVVPPLLWTAFRG